MVLARTQDPTRSDAGQTQSDQRSTASKDARADSRPGTLAGTSRERLLCLSRGAHQHSIPSRIPTLCHRRVAANSIAPQSARACDLGDDAAASHAVVADAAHSASLAQRSFCRQTPKVGAEWCVTPETSVVER